MSTDPPSLPRGRLARTWRTLTAARRQRAATLEADRIERERRQAQDALTIFDQRLEAARTRLRATIPKPAEKPADPTSEQLDVRWLDAARMRLQARIAAPDEARIAAPDEQPADPRRDPEAP